MFHNQNKPSILDDIRKISSTYLTDILIKSNVTLITPNIIEFSDAKQAWNFYVESQLVVFPAPEARINYSETGHEYNYHHHFFIPLNSSTNKPLTLDDKGNFVGYPPCETFTKIMVPPPVSYDSLMAGLKKTGIEKWGGRFEAGKHIATEPEATSSTESKTCEIFTEKEYKAIPRPLPIASSGHSKSCRRIFNFFREIQTGYELCIKDVGLLPLAKSVCHEMVIRLKR